MRLKRTAVYLFCLFWLSGDSFAAETPLLNAHFVKTTPYDQKNALAEVLDRTYPVPAYSARESIERSFLKARRFSYKGDNNGDRWQRPQETEAKRAGDCEDKALWLYARLRAGGYQDLMLVVGKYRSRDAGYHVWLLYRDGNGALFILDPTIQNKIWPLNSFGKGLYQALFFFDGKNRYRSDNGPRN